MKAKETTHSYTGWREQLHPQRRKQLDRIMERLELAAPLTDDQILITLLVKILDEGGETTEYIRDVQDGE